MNEPVNPTNLTAATATQPTDAANANNVVEWRSIVQDKALHENPFLKDTKTVSDLVNRVIFQESKTLLEKSNPQLTVKALTAASVPGEIDEYLVKGGAPESASGYKFEGVDATSPVDLRTEAYQFAQKCKEQNLLPHQANIAWKQHMAGKAEAHNAMVVQAQAESAARDAAFRNAFPNHPTEWQMRKHEVSEVAALFNSNDPTNLLKAARIAQLLNSDPQYSGYFKAQIQQGEEDAKFLRDYNNMSPSQKKDFNSNPENYQKLIDLQIKNKKK